MKHLSAVLMLSVAVALGYVAVDWRAPILVDLRLRMLIGLLTIPLVLIAGEILLLRSLRPEQRALRVSASLGLLAAIFAFIMTLALEARFQSIRHEVRQTDSGRLKTIGRHFIVGYRNLAEVRELAAHGAVSGVFISGANVHEKSVTQVREEIASLQSERRKHELSPLWIATDQEGGIVSRLSPPLNPMPALSELVKQRTDPERLKEAVQEYARSQGRELVAIGVNLNFAPVVDLNRHIVNPNDRFTRISKRAISHDPKVVAQVAGWYCAELEKAGVRCTLKHFPGLGGVFEDTHLEHANLTTPTAELAAADWVPFRELMLHSKAFVMLGHVRLTEIDGERPVSMSPAVIAGLIRDQWKYDGALITDNFTMLAVYRSRIGMDSGAVDALNAGVDLILVSYDPDQYYRIMYALLEADKQRKLDPGALQRSAIRLTNAMRSVGR